MHAVFSVSCLLTLGDCKRTVWRGQEKTHHRVPEASQDGRLRREFPVAHCIANQPAHVNLPIASNVCVRRRLQASRRQMSNHRPPKDDAQSRIGGVRYKNAVTLNQLPLLAFLKAVVGRPQHVGCKHEIGRLVSRENDCKRPTSPCRSLPAVCGLVPNGQREDHGRACRRPQLENKAACGLLC